MTDSVLVIKASPDYDPPKDGPAKAVAVRWHVGDRVRQRYRDRKIGIVASVILKPDCIVYEVALDDSEKIGCHQCELEDAG